MTGTDVFYIYGSIFRQINDRVIPTESYYSDIDTSPLK